MVQIIQRTRPTVGEQIGAGIGGGLQKGMSAALEFGREQKKLAADQKRKQTLAAQIESDPALKDLDPTIRRMLAMETAGLTSAQSTKSAINAIREKIGDERFNEIIGDMGGGMAPSSTESGESPSASVIERPGEIAEEPTNGKRNYENEIAKWQKALGSAKSPEKKEFAKSRISELQHQRDLEQRQEKFEFQKGQAQQTAVDKSYAAQEPFIKDVTSAYKSFETDFKPRLQQLQKLASDDQLISPTASVFLEHLGIPLGALDDPSSELFQKVSQDLLKGLPESYGNRILKVEVENFLKTIPTLENSPEGRRMIATNMLKLGELKEVYYNAMRQMQMNAVDKDEKLPKDFEQRVFDQVLPQINKINQEFVKLSEIKSIPPGHVPFFNPSGNIEFVPKNSEQWAMDNGGKRIW